MLSIFGISTDPNSTRLLLIRFEGNMRMREPNTSLHYSGRIKYTPGEDGRAALLAAARAHHPAYDHEGHEQYDGHRDQPQIVTPVPKENNVLFTLTTVT